MSKNLIYLNGDSFIEGDEITDMFLDDFPGWQDYDKLHTGPGGNIKVIPDINAWSMATWDHKTLNGFVKSRVPYEEQRIVKYALSVSGELQSQVDCDVFCNARAGASMEGIARRTLTDLLKFKSKYDRIVAFVGITSPTRRSIPPARLIDYPNLNEHICFIPHNNITQDDAQNIQKYYVEYSTEYHDMINFFLNAISIKNFCAQHNIELHWINTTLNLEWYENCIKHSYTSSSWLSSRDGYEENINGNMNLIEEKYRLLSENTDYDVLKDELNFSELLKLEKLAQEIGTGIYAPNCHYSPKFHEVLASKLMPVITEGNYAKQVPKNYEHRDALVEAYVNNLNLWREKYHEQNNT